MDKLEKENMVFRSECDERMYKNEQELKGIRAEATCLNDRLGLYLRYGCSKTGVEYDERLDNWYHELRIIELKHKNPKILAACLIYITAVKQGVHITQRDLAEIFVMSEHSIGKIYPELIQILRIK